MKHRLFELKIEILDDSTFTEKQMIDNVNEALKIHLECMGCNVILQKVSFVILDTDSEMAEA